VLTHALNCARASRPPDCPNHCPTTTYEGANLAYLSQFRAVPERSRKPLCGQAASRVRLRTRVIPLSPLKAAGDRWHRWPVAPHTPTAPPCAEREGRESHVATAVPVRADGTCHSMRPHGDGDLYRRRLGVPAALVSAGAKLRSRSPRAQPRLRPLGGQRGPQKPGSARYAGVMPSSQRRGLCRHFGAIESSRVGREMAREALVMKGSGVRVSPSALAKPPCLSGVSPFPGCLQTHPPEAE
jgi:hypothetical protein